MVKKLNKKWALVAHFLLRKTKNYHIKSSGIT